MDFFGKQEQAKRSTTMLVLLMGLGVLGVVAAITALAATLMPHMFFLHFNDPMTRTLHWEPVLRVAGGLTLLIVIASLGKTIALRASRGAGIASSLGGTLVNPSTEDESERRLLNVTEEMAIASGVPVPSVYVLSDESSINAFAAGFTHDEAVIGVTRGSIERLSRDELQGVIAHEFSHILHGDMIFNVRIMGTLYGLLVISEVGRILMRSRSRGKNGGQIVVVGLGLFGIGMVGYGVGAMIRAAVSRQREYLADAAAVQFTRNPKGLSSALSKIGGISPLVAPRAAEVGHMLFAAGLSSWFGSIMATHPPLERRIEALTGLKFAGKASRPAPPSGDSLVSSLSASQVTDTVGTLSSEGVQRAETWLARLDPSLRQAAHYPVGAAALLICMVLNSQPQSRNTQLQELAANDAGLGEAAARLSSAVAQLAPADRQPLIDLATNALRMTSDPQRTWLLKTVQQLIKADGRVNPFEYMIYKVLKQRLQPYKKPSVVETSGASGSSSALAATIVLSAIVTVSGTSDVARGAAFRAGALRLPKMALNSSTPISWDFGKLEAALTRLSAMLPARKKMFIDACAHAIAHDGLIRDEEVCMLRAVSESLRCPMPTFMV